MSLDPDQVSVSTPSGGLNWWSSNHGFLAVLWRHQGAFTIRTIIWKQIPAVIDNTNNYYINSGIANINLKIKCLNRKRGPNIKYRLITLRLIVKVAISKLCTSRFGCRWCTEEDPDLHYWRWGVQLYLQYAILGVVIHLLRFLQNWCSESWILFCVACRNWNMIS